MKQDEAGEEVMSVLDMRPSATSSGRITPTSMPTTSPSAPYSTPATVCTTSSTSCTNLALSPGPGSPAPSRTLTNSTPSGPPNYPPTSMSPSRVPYLVAQPTSWDPASVR